MRLLKILFLCAMASVCSCSNHGDATDAELELARKAGKEQAEKALALPENSMERERAIFAIRARETRLRDAGFESCADAYVKAAAKVLNFPE